MVAVLTAGALAYLSAWKVARAQARREQRLEPVITYYRDLDEPDSQAALEIYDCLATGM
ncbi:hypothetical protein [Streptomyces yaizuensis]|uniref:Uncharacterized protein n=1 Tax=Streptomyces yaizuensis TaxID=2989713 RepID=A0ABQ5P674_9ACTN|nr:hypothetical protein [Streptomyces sp. YSPA8]GLF98069.1 hypothetical protein SYYSPA8_27250 [Streptomyces sp. YSPA8]